jgi:membrane-bound lytic murein transglycosylase MltF
MKRTHKQNLMSGVRSSQEATTRGLDPNVWFQNVEYIAAEKVGQETVTYVSNIYKYYIAYRLILESRASAKAAVEKIQGDAK